MQGDAVVGSRGWVWDCEGWEFCGFGADGKAGDAGELVEFAEGAGAGGCRGGGGEGGFGVGDVDGEDVCAFFAEGVGYYVLGCWWGG